MGTPEFATASLDAIYQSSHEVVAVVTAPDRPAGRGKKLTASAVKEYALEKNIPVLQPEKLRDPDFLSALEGYQADIFVVVAFRMLPEVVWSMPPKGTFNLHASLLPQYRGAAPINHAIINGEKKTGATTFFIEKEIDTGNVIDQIELEIEDSDNAGSLHDKLMVKGAALVVKTLDEIEKGKVSAKKQELHPDETYHDAPKIFKEDCRIDWNQDQESIYNFIRGLSPYPAAWTEMQFPGSEESISFKIFETKRSEVDLSPGEIKSDGKSYILVGNSKGSLEILRLQMQGKKAMATEDFLRGFTLENGVKFN